MVLILVFDFNFKNVAVVLGITVYYVLVMSNCFITQGPEILAKTKVKVRLGFQTF